MDVSRLDGLGWVFANGMAHINAAQSIDAILKLVKTEGLAPGAAEHFDYYLESMLRECSETPGFDEVLADIARGQPDKSGHRAVAGYCAALYVLADSEADPGQTLQAVELWRDSVVRLLEHSPSLGHLAHAASSSRWDDVRHGHVEDLSLLEKEMILLLPQVLSVYAREEPFKAIEEAEATLCSYRKLAVNLELVEVIAGNACAVLERPDAVYKKEEAITVVYALTRAMDFADSGTPLFNDLAVMKDVGVRVLSARGYNAHCTSPCRAYSRKIGNTAVPS